MKREVFKIGRRYPIGLDNLARVQHLIPEKVDTRRGTRFQGELTWRVWTETGKPVDIEIGKETLFNIVVGSEPDPAIPPVMR